MNSHLLLFLHIPTEVVGRSWCQTNSSRVIMSVILMTTLFYKALMLQGEIWFWSLLGFKGLISHYFYANFFFWNPESGKILHVKSGMLGFGIRNTAQRVRNPTNNCGVRHPETKFHWKRLESSTVKPLLSGSPIKRTISRVPKRMSYISLYNEPLFSGLSGRRTLK